MIRGGKVLLVSAGLATAGCTSTQQVQVRAIPDPSAKYHYSGGLLAEGRGQLAVGAVGTALETFRKLQREQPNGPDAFAGIAACYAAMGRFDLERQSYEFALAYSPHDPALLSALASSLERQGEGARATEIRQEIARLATPVPAKAQVEEANVVPLAVPQMGSVTVKLPPANQAVLKRATLASNVEIAAPAAPVTAAMDKAVQPSPAATMLKAAMPAPQSASVAPAISLASSPLFKNPTVALAQTAAARIETQQAEGPPAAMMPRPQLGSVTVKLPALRAAVLKPAAFKNDTVLVAAAPSAAGGRDKPGAAKSEALDPALKPKQRKSLEQPNMPNRSGPYLERLSSGEVALVTNPGPIWHAPVLPAVREARGKSRAPKTDAVAALALATPVHWVPLDNASTRPTIQLLNAARSDGLAASTRTALVNRGWRKIGIGNARQVRERSVVLYTPLRAVLGRRLAAQFGCKAVKVEGGDKVLVLLGRDAATRRAASSRA
jgi:LytR cell envelope-related transcriptional attenuator